MPHEYPWCFMSTHDASWVLMMHHHEHSWFMVNTHDASWVIMVHHKYSWCIMNTHDAPWVHFEKVLDAQVLCMPSKNLFWGIHPRIPWIPRIHRIHLIQTIVSLNPLSGPPFHTRLGSRWREFKSNSLKWSLAILQLSTVHRPPTHP